MKLKKSQKRPRVEFLEEMARFFTLFDYKDCTFIECNCMINRPNDCRPGHLVWGFYGGDATSAVNVCEAFWRQYRANVESYPRSRLLYITHIFLNYTYKNECYAIRVDLKPKIFDITFRKETKLKKPYLQYERSLFHKFDPALLHLSEFDWHSPKEIADFFNN